MMDSDFFLSALQGYDDRLQVLTAAADMLPLDLFARRHRAAHRHGAGAFRFRRHRHARHRRAVDRNGADAAEHYYALMELEMRSAQNALRLIRALKAEGLALEKLRFVLNRAPRSPICPAGPAPGAWPKASTSSSPCMLPDGGAQVTHGQRPRPAAGRGRGQEPAAEGNPQARPDPRQGAPVAARAAA
jgi:pilus assembly protein CpaE